MDADKAKVLSYLGISALLVKKDLLTSILSKEKENTSPQGNGPGPWTAEDSGMLEYGVEREAAGKGGWETERRGGEKDVIVLSTRPQLLPCYYRGCLWGLRHQTSHTAGIRSQKY